MAKHKEHNQQAGLAPFCRASYSIASLIPRYDIYGQPKKSADVYYPGLTDMLGEGFISEHPAEDRLNAIQRRIHEKMDDYRDYSFSATEKRALMIFFDLAQEFDTLEEFFQYVPLFQNFFSTWSAGCIWPWHLMNSFL